MELKYYTPAIEEFHVGFEFEHLNFQGKLISNHPSNTVEWHKEICDADWFNILLDDYEHSSEEVNKYRVKHLDREDIESLGFVYSNVNSEYYSLNGFDLTNLDNNYFNIYEDKGADEYCFRGTIKNKSELKKLMQMLNII